MPNPTAPVRFTRIAIQMNALLDSLVATILLMNYGSEKYPGVEDAEIELWGTGSMNQAGKTWQQHLAEGKIMIGVGGSQFDEHPSKDFGDRKAQMKSATMLVAEDLGIANSKLFKGLIERVTKNDLTLVPDEDNLGNCVKQMHNAGVPIEEILACVSTIIKAKIRNQELFLEACDEFKKSGVTKSFQGPLGIYCIGTIASDNANMGKAARYCNPKIAAFVQRKSTGQVQIFANQKFNPVMDEVARMLRIRELEYRGWAHDDIVDVEPTLRNPGQLEVAPWWCYQMPGQNLLNGSLTAQDVEPTMLPYDEICLIVSERIRFEPSEMPLPAGTH